MQVPKLMAIPGLSWALLCSPGLSWALLGSPGLSWACGSIAFLSFLGIIREAKIAKSLRIHSVFELSGDHQGSKNSKKSAAP